jgi:hypothetical protein
MIYCHDVTVIIKYDKHMHCIQLITVTGQYIAYTMKPRPSESSFSILHFKHIPTLTLPLILTRSSCLLS